MVQHSEIIAIAVVVVVVVVVVLVVVVQNVVGYLVVHNTKQVLMTEMHE